MKVHLDRSSVGQVVTIGRRERTIMLVAEDDGRLCGCYCLQADDADVWDNGEPRWVPELWFDISKWRLAINDFIHD